MSRHDFVLAFAGQPREALPVSRPIGLIQSVVGWSKGRCPAAWVTLLPAEYAEGRRPAVARI